MTFAVEIQIIKHKIEKKKKNTRIMSNCKQNTKKKKKRKKRKRKGKCKKMGEKMRLRVFAYKDCVAIRRNKRCLN